MLINTSILGTVLDLMYTEPFPMLGGEFWENVIIFGTDISSSSNIYNKKKGIFILGKSPS